MKPGADLQQRIDELHQARANLANASRQARQTVGELRPDRVFKGSIKRHPWRWTGGSLATGWIMMKVIRFGRKNRRSKKAFTKGSFVGMIIASTAALLRIPAEEIARRKLHHYFSQSHDQPSDKPSADHSRNNDQTGASD